MVKGRIKTECIILIWLVLTALWGGFFVHLFHINDLTTYSYTALALFWVYSLKDEIPNTYIRRNMSLSGLLLTLLFIFRFIKYHLVTPNTFPHRLMWYGYYIPILITPLLSLMISLAIGGRDMKKYRILLTLLKTICAVLLVVVLTNDLHGLAIKIRYVGDEEYSSMGLFGYLVIIWYVLLTLSTFIIAIRKCIISSFNMLWMLPAAVELLGLILWFWYYIVCGGSSPKIGGNSLYNIQEIYEFLFIGFWESMIGVGLIPTVSLARDRAWISDKISGTVRSEITEIRSILDRLKEADDETFRDGISRISFIGIYIKRRANLELMASKTGLLSSGELSLAIREAIGFFDFSKITAGFEESGEAVEVPEAFISGTLKMLKNIISKTASACYVKLVTGRSEQDVSVTLNVEFDMNTGDPHTAADALSSLADKEFFRALGAELEIFEEDDTWNIALTASYPVVAGKTLSVPALYKRSGYGLSQITSYHSLEKESLEAKTRIHDSLGRCLLVTKAYLTGRYPMSKEAIIAEWDRIITEISEGSLYKPVSISSNAEYYVAQAKNMGVELEFTGEIPEDPRFRKVLDTALTVHITNVLRHALGNKAYIEIKTTETAVIFSFTNNGNPPKGPIIEKGGLKNLRQHVEEMGGTMDIRWEEGFNMILTFPNGEKL